MSSREFGLGRSLSWPAAEGFARQLAFGGVARFGNRATLL